jgi:hypothetical protein
VSGDSSVPPDEVHEKICAVFWYFYQKPTDLTTAPSPRELQSQENLVIPA